MLFDDDEDELDLNGIGFDEEDPDEDEEPEDEEEDEDDTPDADEDEEDEDGEIERKPTRGSRQFGELRKARREAEAAKLALQQENERLKAEAIQRNNYQAQQTQQQFLESLDPQERPLAELRIAQNQHAQQMQQVQFQMADTADRTAFEAKALANPLYAKFGAEVQKRLDDLRNNQRINVPREEILKHIVGELVLKSKGKAVSKETAKKNLKAQKTPVGSKRSDSNGSARKSGKTPAERLAGVKF